MASACHNKSNDSLWPGKISCEVLPKGRVLPHSSLSLGGVCRADGSFVESSALHEELYDGSYPYDETKVEKKAGVAVFLGTWHKLYGHRFTDNIKKLWYLFTPEYKALCEEYADKGGVELVYTYMWGREATACMDEVCTALGLDVRTMHPVYAEEHQCGILEGMRAFYASDLYRSLEREETKLWHLGAVALYEMWKNNRIWQQQ